MQAVVCGCCTTGNSTTSGLETMTISIRESRSKFCLGLKHEKSNYELRPDLPPSIVFHVSAFDCHRQKNNIVNIPMAFINEYIYINTFGFGAVQVPVLEYSIPVLPVFGYTGYSYCTPPV